MCRINTSSTAQSRYEACSARNEESFEGQFVYVSDDEDATQVCDGPLTWYDARETHPSRTEYRLYFRRMRSLN